MISGKKYEKPMARNLNDLTPALGLCTSGFNDGGCVPGTSAGGGGCATGTYASSTGGSCSDGNLIYSPGSTCSHGSNKGG